MTTTSSVRYEVRKLREAFDMGYPSSDLLTKATDLTWGIWRLNREGQAVERITALTAESSVQLLWIAAELNAAHNYGRLEAIADAKQYVGQAQDHFS